MPWVKIDDGFTDHPKVMAAGPMASWLYVCSLTYSARLLTDGFIPFAQVRKLADIEDAMPLADTLVSVGLWRRVEAGFVINDYLDYNPSAEKVKAERKAAQERMQRIRSGELRPNNERSSPEVRAPRPLPVPLPVPVPVPTTSESAGAPLKTRGSTQLPEDWWPDEALASWAVGEQFSDEQVRNETLKFVEHWRSKGDVRKDWSASWRLWMRRSREFAPARASPRNREPPEQRRPAVPRFDDFRHRYEKGSGG